MVAEYFLALGFTLFFSAVTVYLRDMEYVVGILMMAWIWATPIMYTMDKLPQWVQQLLIINPMTMIVMNYHDILYYQKLSSISVLLIAIGVGIIATVIGEVVFVKLEGNFAEEL